MSQKKANHICKYSKCNLGENGERKKYYACDYCDGSANYRSVACCREHFDKYTQEVLDARAKARQVDLLPERLDKTREEVLQIMDTPLETLKEQSIAEIAEIVPNVEEVGIQVAVDMINSNATPKKKNKKGSVAQ